MTEPTTPQIIEAGDLPGQPDALQRLWTPYRMVYIDGQDKPTDSSEQECPFCRAPRRTDPDALIDQAHERAAAAAGAQALRTSEDVVRQTLAPVQVPAPAPAPVPVSAPDASAAAAPEVSGEANAAQPAAPPVDPAVVLPAMPDDLDRTVRQPRAPGSRVPAFLEPGETVDPLRLAEEGSLAERLGLSPRESDDETDVGPVR